MAFLDLVSELTGTLPGLSPILAQRYINRALAEIRRERAWSFLITDGVVVCPTMVTAGAAAITQYSADVTLDATASAAMLPQTITGAVPGIQQLQMRFGASPTLGGVYSILECDATNPAALILSLDRVVQEATDAASAYQIYRAYITPPIDDFLKWESLVDFANAITLTGPTITWKSANFDQRDPQRTSQGLAYFLGGWGGNRADDLVTGATVPNATVDADSPIYELWPHPTSGQTFYCRFHRQGVNLVNPTDVQPDGISDGLILSRAIGWHAGRWALLNQGSFPNLKGVNLPAVIATSKADYKMELTTAKRNDDAQQLQSVYNRGHGLRTGGGSMPGIVDAQYVQSHLLNW